MTISLEEGLDDAESGLVEYLGMKSWKDDLSELYWNLISPSAWKLSPMLVFM